MFERYTEPARRAIFFARYEAAVRDSDLIEAEDMVKGILREEEKRLALFLAPDVLEVIRGCFPVTRAIVQTEAVKTPVQVNFRKKSWVPDWLFKLVMDIETIEAGEEYRDRQWLKKFLVDQDRLSRDIALSDECKRALAYAAEDSYRLNQHHIGALHLFLGILRDHGKGAKALSQCGVDLDVVRKAAQTEL